MLCFSTELPAQLLGTVAIAGNFGEALPAAPGDYPQHMAGTGHLLPAFCIKMGPGNASYISALGSLSGDSQV